MENRRCRSLQKSLQVWAAETCCMKVPTALLRPMSTLFGCLSAQALCQKLSWWLRMFKSLKNLRDFVTLCMSCQQISSPSTVSNQTETTPCSNTCLSSANRSPFLGDPHRCFYALLLSLLGHMLALGPAKGLCGVTRMAELAARALVTSILLRAADTASDPRGVEGETRRVSYAL